MIAGFLKLYSSTLPPLPFEKYHALKLANRGAGQIVLPRQNRIGKAA
jgi:hypothetical protein